MTFSLLLNTFSKNDVFDVQASKFLVGYMLSFEVLHDNSIKQIITYNNNLAIKI